MPVNGKLFALGRRGWAGHWLRGAFRGAGALLYGNESIWQWVLFDPVARRFDWTPRAEDQGEHTVNFQVFDGTEQKKCSVVLKVKNGLIF